MLHKQLCGWVILCALSGSTMAQEVREWTGTNGYKVVAKLERPSASHVTLVDANGKKANPAYNSLITEDLVYIAKVSKERGWPQTEAPITSVMEERIPELVKNLKLDEVGQLRKDLPFMENFIDATLVEGLKTADLPKINDITKRFPGIRDSILDVISKRLKNPTDEFFAVGKFSDFGNHNDYIEKKIAAYQEVASKYPEVKADVVEAIKAELSDPTKSRFWDDLRLLSRLETSFPDAESAVKEALLRSIRNPATLEQKQHLVFEDSFGVQFNKEEVTEHLGGYVTKRGRHPVRPKEVLSIEVFDRRRMEAIVTQWPAYKPALEAAIKQELQNTARRWSWDELRELVNSFPNIREDAKEVVERDLTSPKPQFQNVKLAELIQSFPELEDVVERRIERDLANSQRDYSPETLIDLVKRYPGVRMKAEDRLRKQMEDTAFNRDFENLDRLQQIATAFPNLNDRVEVVLARMTVDSTDKDGKPDLDLVRQIASTFPARLDSIEASFAKALKNPLVRWSPKELEDLVTILPGLEPTLAAVLTRHISSVTTVDQLLQYARQFPSIKDHCSSLVLENVKDPTKHIDLKKLMEIAWRFPSLSEDLESYVDRAVDRLVDNRYQHEHSYYYAYNGRMIEFFGSLIKDYPDQEGLIRDVIYRRIERIAQHSDEISLKEWYLNNKAKLPYDERVAKELAKRGIEMPNPAEQEVIAESPESSPGSEPFKNEPSDENSLGDDDPLIAAVPRPDGSAIPLSIEAPQASVAVESTKAMSEMTWQERAAYILRTYG